MPAVPPHLHELEAELMHELWQLGEANVGVLLERLNDRNDKQRAYNTILSVLTRLQTKGLLERHKRGRSHVYRPTLSLSDYQRARAGAQVAELVDEYGDAALAQFLQTVEELDPERLDALRRLAGQ